MEMRANSHLRPAAPADLAQVLALNAASVHYLSPLTPARLEHLHARSAHHRVVADEGGVQAFLLAFREGADYDSPNYQWFAARYPRFLYIDRVVVSAACRGQGLGRLLYDDLFAFARHADAACVVCEFDVDPPNEPSRRFHERYGFREVGSQLVAGGAKRVSLQAVRL